MQITRENFRTQIPALYPGTDEYVLFWKEEKRRCIEGYWVSGVWMPPKLYFYINYGTIKLNKGASKVKVLDRPFLRDLEWEFFYHWEEARGFSGFNYDEEFSCHRALTTDLTDEEIQQQWCYDEENIFIPEAYYNLYKKDGTRKTYIPAREYLRKIHSSDLGRPLHFNEALNLFMMGSRGYGKSYSVGVGIVAHEFLFDGLTHYTEETTLQPPSAEIVMGAGDAKYSTETLDKTRLALEELPGAVEFNGKFFPSPFSKQYSGSWTPASQVTAQYRKKIGGTWKYVGSKSNIKHRTFKDNPFAANGTRPGTLIYEEVGMFDNLKEAYAASVECQRSGSFKFGSMLFLGTGGDMNGGGTRDAYEIFYNPKAYDCVPFTDVWEHKGDIGYFVPAYLGLNQFKDGNGTTNVKAAKKFLNDVREKLSKSRSSTALDGEIVNRPIKPSEIFLLRHGNIFPIAELHERLAKVETGDTLRYIQNPVTLYFDTNAPRGIGYKIDTKNELRPINDFPYDGHDREGAVVIYEFPETDEKGNIPKDLYIIGHDPYATDDPSGSSLGVIYVLKTKRHKMRYGHDEIVASYVGRPYNGRSIVNEILLKLSLFYGEATIYFENVRGNVKEYFEKKKRLDLLAKQPQTVLAKRASYETSAPQIYGYPMSNRQMKMEGIQYLRDWLLEERGNIDGKPIRNLDKIHDRGLLQELIAFNLEGNFDRVMAFMGCIIGLEETYNQYEEALHEESFFDNSLNFFANNPNLFKNNVHTNIYVPSAEAFI